MKTKLARLCLTTVTTLCAAVLTAQNITTTATGIRVVSGKTAYTVEYPMFMQSSGDKPQMKPLEVKLGGSRKADLKYQDGAGATVNVKDGGEVVISFFNIPGSWTRMRFNAMLGFSLAQGGTFAIDGGAAKKFPEVKPASPVLYQGSPGNISLTTFDGTTVTFGFPRFAYVQLQDNREWGWKMHQLHATAPYNRDWKTYHLKFSTSTDEAVAAAAPDKRVDLLGQNNIADWPQKVKSIEELKADVETEGAYYDSLVPADAPKLNQYGGLSGSGAELGLTKTGFFHVEKLTKSPLTGKWVLVDPEGDLCFHLGVCCFLPYQSATKVEGREDVYEWLPPRDGEYSTAWGDKHISKYSGDQFNFHVANQIRKYGKPYDPTDWATLFIDRVRAIGFNAAGAFGAPDKTARESKSFPFTSNLPLSKWSNGMKEIDREVIDPFDQKNRERIDENFKALAKYVDDKLLVGYFISNEPLYENLPAKIPTLNSTWACKVELVNMLEEKYKTIAAFSDAWDVRDVETFDQLKDKGLPVKTKQAAQDMADYMHHFHETFLSLVCGTARKYDPNHMIIGTRLQHGTINNEQYCKIMAKYFDVISFNYYTYGFDMPFLEKIMGWIGDKPLMFTEFYWNSPPDSGLPGGVKDVASQTERGLAYRHYVENAAFMPWVVGVQWYSLLDTHYTGVGFAGYGGWNANEGLFDVTDRPWKKMIEHMVKTNHEIYDVILGKRRPFVWDDPRFADKSGALKTAKASKTLTPITIDGRSDDWPGVPAETIGTAQQVDGRAGSIEAAFKVCWDDANLYLFADVTDPTPLQNSIEGANIWNADAIEIFISPEIKLSPSGGLRFSDRHIILAMREAADGVVLRNAPEGRKPEGVKYAVSARPDGTGYQVEAAIPWSVVDITPAMEAELSFDLAIDDGETPRRRERQSMWNGSRQNSTSSDNWGRLRLIQ
jgi:hypothetical protein